MPASDENIARPVYLKLESADVCHSFWAPRLAGKVDLIPGRTNGLVLQTREAGLHLGQCAEYCGTQHANMLLRVVVEEPEAFQAWLAAQQAPAAGEPDAHEPAAEDSAVREGRELFLAQSCVNCHRVRGSKANGRYAPDLTHLMSRQTLASGEIENTAENLARWVRDPQAIKPGCLMPAFGLGDREQEKIVRYLSSLH